MKENPKQFTRSEIRNFTRTRAEATNVTETQMRLQMEGEFSARQRIVDFLVGAKEGDSKFEYFKLITDTPNPVWNVRDTNTAKDNPTFMTIAKNREFLKIHKEFEDIRIDYWLALSERSFSLKYTDKLLSQELKKIRDQKTAEFRSESQLSQTPPQK